MKHTIIISLTAIILGILSPECIKAQVNVHAFRLSNYPIITPEMLRSEDGQNINGPSLIRVPKWVKNPLGKYYLYFAHHNGKYIRLAYADRVEGPYKIYEKGSLRVEECNCGKFKDSTSGHIASPDVHIDSKNKRIILYFHCPVILNEKERNNFAEAQVTMRSSSQDGIHFTAESEMLGDSYFRVFKYHNFFYAIANRGTLYRSENGFSHFEKGNNPFLKIQNPSTVRHSAIIIRKDTMYIFYSRIGDMPERILMSKIQLGDNWNDWTPSEPETILEPGLENEGVNQPLKKSVSGASKKPVRELRDPAIFEENGKVYLLFSIAGEKGISIAGLKFDL